MAGLRDKLTSEDEVKRRSLEFEKRYGSNAKNEEQGLEEGDVTDYVMPIKGLSKNLLKAVSEKSIKSAGKAAKKEAVKEVKEAAAENVLAYPPKKPMERKPEVQGPDYTKENIAFRPTKKPKQEGWERFSFGK